MKKKKSTTVRWLIGITCVFLSLALSVFGYFDSKISRLDNRFAQKGTVEQMCGTLKEIKDTVKRIERVLIKDGTLE